MADMTAASKTGASSSANEPQSKLVKDIMSRQAEQEAARAVPQAVSITVNVPIVLAFSLYRRSVT